MQYAVRFIRLLKYYFVQVSPRAFFPWCFLFFFFLCRTTAFFFMSLSFLSFKSKNTDLFCFFLYRRAEPPLTSHLPLLSSKHWESPFQSRLSHRGCYCFTHDFACLLKAFLFVLRSTVLRLIFVNDRDVWLLQVPVAELVDTDPCVD